MDSSRQLESTNCALPNRRRGRAIAFALVVWASIVPAQSAVSTGTFVNMDFETWEMCTPCFEEIRVLGWTQPGQSPFSRIRFNTWNIGDNPDIWISTVEAGGTLAGSTSINVMGTYWLPNTPPPPRVADALPFGGVRPLFAAIEQTGQIPEDYASMRFSYAGSLPIVFVGGDLVSAAALGNGIGAVDISAFAGQTVLVQFRADHQDNPTFLPPVTTVHFARYFRLDDIYFSTEPMPEPLTLLLVGAGAALTVRRRR
jgi:hypothetical protein